MNRFRHVPTGALIDAQRGADRRWVIAQTGASISDFFFREDYVPAGENHEILMEGGGTMSRNEAFRQGLITPNGTISDLSDPEIAG